MIYDFPTVPVVEPRDAAQTPLPGELPVHAEVKRLDSAKTRDYRLRRVIATFLSLTNE